MISRRQHLEEMQYALVHRCSLAEARGAIAAHKRRAAEAAVRHLQERPIISGRALRQAQDERRRRELQGDDSNGPKPWMMAD